MVQVENHFGVLYQELISVYLAGRDYRQYLQGKVVGANVELFEFAHPVHGDSRHGLQVDSLYGKTVPQEPKERKRACSFYH